MIVRKTDGDKLAAATPPAAKKAAAKTKTMPPSARLKVEVSPAATATPKTVEPKRASAGMPKGIGVAADSKPEASVKQVSQVSTVAKPVSRTKIVKKVIRKVIRKIPASARAPSARTIASGAVDCVKNEETMKEKTLLDIKNTETGNNNPAADDNPLFENVEPSRLENETIHNHRIFFQKEEDDASEPEKHFTESGENLSQAIDPMVINSKPEPCATIEKEEPKEEKEEQIKIIVKGDLNGETIKVEDSYDQVTPGNAFLDEHDDGKIEGLSDQEVHEDFGGEDLADDDAPENEAKVETLEEERLQLNAAARERKLRKEREIFVGGLGRDAVEDDVRKVFKYAGEVVKVRMHVDPSTNKNRGYAFVQFATKEQASHALSEMKNPVVRIAPKYYAIVLHKNTIQGKRCGTAPSEDNDTLFLGNICNTWTKEAIKQKMKDYGIEGEQNVTLVADPRQEGLSRGFAFVEFSSHAEAMLAYKRLQKPDVVFGHSERTAKVAFAEPLREPDPKVMAQVKSVFIDGLPPHWDEDRVRENLQIFGEIFRIMLARNMPTAKRKDFGFVDFSTHEAAVLCVEGVNENGLGNGNSKVKVHARLSNPLPKMQAVKGGMCGGFYIGHGRGVARGGRCFNRYGRGLYPHRPEYGGSMGFSDDLDMHEFDNPYPRFHGRPNFERGRRWGFKGAYEGPPPSRPYPDRVRHGANGTGYGDYDSHRPDPYSFEEGYDRSFMGRHIVDSYPYDDVDHRIKRPYYMMDPDLAEPSRHRPRRDQSDPVIPFHRNRYRASEDLGADDGFFRCNHYGSDYGGCSYSSFYGDDRTYGCGFYY